MAAGSKLLVPIWATSIVLATGSTAAWATDPPFYVGVAYGQAAFDTALDVREGDVPLLFEPEDDGDSISIDLGYQFDTDWFLSVEYSRIDADDVEIDNVYVSLNYRWPLGRSAAVFAGVLAGGSTLDWQDAPIDALNRDRENEEALWGVQAGFSYDLGRHWRVMGRYQFLAPEHETRLEPSSGRATFTHEEFHHVTIGLQLRF